MMCIDCYILNSFRQKIDCELANKNDILRMNFLMKNNKKGIFSDEDLAEVRGYYSGLKVAKEMLQRSIDEVGVEQASVKKGTKLYYHCYDRVENGRHLCEVPDIVTAVMNEGFFVSPRTNSDGTFKPDEDQFYKWSAIGKEYFLTMKDAEQSMKECEENATTGSD